MGWWWCFWTGPSKSVTRIPKVGDKKLQNLFNDFYKGVNNPKRIGSGTTADAVRHELRTGNLVYGRGHVQKAQDLSRGLQNWINKNPNASGNMRNSAQSVLDDLTKALGGN